MGENDSVVYHHLEPEGVLRCAGMNSNAEGIPRKDDLAESGREGRQSTGIVLTQAIQHGSHCDPICAETMENRRIESCFRCQVWVDMKGFRSPLNR